eukprot:2873406-Rhodomonas_salina.1
MAITRVAVLLGVVWVALHIGAAAAGCAAGQLEEAPASAVCPVSYTEFEGTCYKYIAEHGMYYRDVTQWCKDDGAFSHFLMSATSELEAFLLTITSGNSAWFWDYTDVMAPITVVCYA